MENADFGAQEAALKAFEGAGADIPEILDGVLEQLKVCGVPFFEWADLRKLVQAKLVLVLAASQEAAPFESSISPRRETFESEQAKLLSALEYFRGAPFTLQRLAEVLLAPRRAYYRDTRTLLAGCEKLLSVSSLIPREDPRAFFARQREAAQAREASDTLVAAAAAEFQEQQQQQQQQQQQGSGSEPPASPSADDGAGDENAAPDEAGAAPGEQQEEGAATADAAADEGAGAMDLSEREAELGADEEAAPAGHAVAEEGAPSADAMTD